MSSNRRRLKGMLGSDEPGASPAPVQKGPAFHLSTTAVGETELPPQLDSLRAPLQEIARRYLGARRRSGEALLEAARWLAEARTAAAHGEWQSFLDATGTSADTAERLLHIHITAMQNPQFADAIARNWLGQSVAALLARPSTPPEVIDEALKQPNSPSIAAVEQAIARRRGRTSQPGQTPQAAEFPPPAADNPAPLRSARPAPGPADDPMIAALHQVVALLEHAAHAGARPTHSDAALALVQAAEQALNRIRRQLTET